MGFEVEREQSVGGEGFGFAGEDPEEYKGGEVVTGKEGAEEGEGKGSGGG